MEKTNKTKTEALKVYCDNEKLRDQILKDIPTKNGLFTHELSIIFYANISHLKSEETEFPSWINYNNLILYPNLLLDSLIARDYIKLASSEELLDYLTMKDIRYLLKYKKIKGEKPFTKKNLVQILMKNYEKDEIKDLLGYSYYIPTVKGIEELKENCHIGPKGFFGFKKREANLNGVPLLNIDEIKIIDSNNEIVSLFIDENRYIIKNSKINVMIHNWFYDFNKEVSLNLYNNQELVVTDIVCYKIVIFSSIKKLVFINKNLDNYDHIGFDIEKNSIIFKETHETEISRYEFNYREFNSEIDRNILRLIKEKDKINYYVALKNTIPISIINKVANNSAEIVKIDEKPLNDSSINYIFKINESDNYARNMIMVMIHLGLLIQPVFNNVSISRLLRHLQMKNSFRGYIDKWIFEEVEAKDEDFKKEFKIFAENVSDNWTFAMDIYSKIFPFRILNHYGYDDFSAYSKYASEPEFEYHYIIKKGRKIENKSIIRDISKDDYNWSQVRYNSEYWISQFQKIIDELTLEGVISAKWKNEFELFKIAKKHYPDSIFQYRSEWLGNQSLDIYIPSINIAIEYQGEQHYKSIEFFGGEEGFQRRVNLDEEKIIKCKINNVNLIHWSYELPVSLSNFNDVLKKYL